MKSLFNYIIKTDNRYNNSVDVDGVELIVNTEITERDAIFVNRIGSIISVPIDRAFGSIPNGSEVIVHHNVFRRMVGINGKEMNSTSYLEEDKYLVYADQIFAYRNSGDWIACEGYCFVQPRDNEDTWINGHESLLSGIIKYTDKNLASQGVKEGDLVGFTPNSEYEFNIDGNKLYRVQSNQINVNYGNKNNTTEKTGVT